MKIKLSINFTNLMGAIVVIASLFLKSDQGIWAGAMMVMGRSAIAVIKDLKNNFTDKYSSTE